MHSVSRRRPSIQNAADTWPDWTDDDRWVPTDDDRRWAAENLNHDDCHTDDPMPDDVYDGRAEESADLDGGAGPRAVTDTPRGAGSDSAPRSRTAQRHLKI